jgi:hypothetical protein
VGENEGLRVRDPALDAAGKAVEAAKESGMIGACQRHDDRAASRSCGDREENASSARLAIALPSPMAS